MKQQKDILGTGARAIATAIAGLRGGNGDDLG
jgi:hypothetical protein